MRYLLGIVMVLAFAARAEAAGLLVPDDRNLPPLRITQHRVNVSIEDRIAITDLAQTFHNDTGQRLEATYVFPIPEDADITNFQMTFNGKMVTGRVLPADEARQIYESIVRQSKDPGLIEFIGRRLLQMRVFPIEPESDTTIKLRYQQICRPTGGMVGYHYPLRTRKASGQVYGEVSFNVALHTPSPLKNIWSPSHAVEIVRDGEHTARIGYEASGGSLSDDFLLLYATDDTDLGLSVVAHRPADAKDGHFVLMLTPKQIWTKQAYQPQDVVFVHDTSGSMAGAKLEQARQALRFCIESLDQRDRFSVVRFSTGFDVLFDGLATASKEHRDEARQWVAGFNAAGGTNIGDTLTHVVTMLRDRAEREAGRPFVVVFLTDGMGNRQPDDVMNMLAAATDGKTSLRIFPFGVGHDVNTILLDRLAVEYTGKPTYVQPGENLEIVLGDFFSVISQPVLTNLRLSLPGIDASEQFPPTLGDLYHGQQLIVAGRYGNAAEGPVKLTAMRSGEKVEYTWPAVSFASTAEATYVPSVWAGRKIAFLIDQVRTHGESTEMIAEIVALSQQYGIQTPYTSWLVDPERQIQLTRVAAQRGGGVFAGSGGGGGGVFGSPDDRARQFRALQTAGRTAGGDSPSAPTAAGVRFGDADGSLDLFAASEAVREEGGKAANVIARRNAAMRGRSTLDEDRLDVNMLLGQRIGSRWYNRIDRFLVDEDFDEKSEVTVVRFASDAYFELVNSRADLRGAMAASTEVVLVVKPGVAILVSAGDGLEEFSDEQREQFGL
ncbi:MAG: VIT domain-containing protein [Planctomycetota bacterium]|jgi:Ca-activated chloride channel family protein